MEQVVRYWFRYCVCAYQLTGRFHWLYENIFCTLPPEEKKTNQKP